MLMTSLSRDWKNFGTLHNLAYHEIESLMSCREIVLSERAHVALLRDQLRCAICSRDFDQTERFLCLFIRAQLEEVTDDTTEELATIVLEVALRDEKKVGLTEAVCVRLARVLAVKLANTRKED